MNVLAVIAITFLSITGHLQAQPAMQNESRFASDRVLVKLANTPNMRSSASGPGIAQSPPNLGISYSEIRLLNPSKGNVNLRAFSTMNFNDKQNNVYVLELEETGEEAVEKALKVLNANPAVEIAEPVFYYKLYRTTNDPMFFMQYAFNKINTQKAWDITTGSKDVVVGIIDTGIDGAHPDLADNLWVNPNPNSDSYINDIHGYDFVNRKGGIPTDVNGHGTHVSGIIGAKGNNGTGVTGVNWDVSLAWLGIGLEGNSVSIDAAIEALNYANNHNISITNNSYGGPGYSEIFEQEIRNYKGLFVAAAGNDSNNNDDFPFYPASYDLPNVISVASTDEYDNLSSFSNYGVNSVHIAAPGSNILSTIPNDQYQQLSGTSMASPFVAGVAALIKAVHPNYSPEQIKEVLIWTSRFNGKLKGFINSGIVDAYVVLEALSSGNMSSRIDLSQTNPPPAGLRWTFRDDIYFIEEDAFVSITGNNTGSARRIEVKNGATAYITLENASITGLETGQSPLLLNSNANVMLTLVGNNLFEAGANCAGIQTTDAKLRIDGAGSLTATGGNNGAGIGGSINGAGGAITITGGVVTATGGMNAQGIGSGSGSASAGIFTIDRYAVVIANSVGDTEINRRTGGILFEGDNGAYYGKNVMISADITIPANLTIPTECALIISTDVTLTIPEDITLMNNGMIINFGTIIGTVTGNLPLTDYPLVNTIDLSEINPFPLGNGWTFNDNIYTVIDGANVTITGTSINKRRIEVMNNSTANITLNDVTIQDLDRNQSPLLLNRGANLTLVLEGINIFTAGERCAGIQTTDATLAIEGSGSLTTTGDNRIGGAGIGGSYRGQGGNLTINNGTITAIGGVNSAGIGGGYDGVGGGNITINNGIINASGSSGIGGAYSDMGGANLGSVSKVTINGGMVTTTGDVSGIGGLAGTGIITINGGIVTATSSSSGVGIGKPWCNATETLSMNGNAVVFASSVSDKDESRKKGGILFSGDCGKVYGNVELAGDIEIPDGYFLIIPSGSTLTIPDGITLTNSGTVIENNNGTININGAWVGNPYMNKEDIMLSNIIDLDNFTFPIGEGWTYGNNNVFTIEDDASVIVTGTNTNQRRIAVAADANVYITLNNVSITELSDYQSPMLLNSGANVTLTLFETNTLLAGKWCAGIQTSGATLKIDGTGSLTVTGGIGGAGIGSSDNYICDNDADSNITISSGTIKALGGYFSAGIGGSSGNTGGNITITGGTVEATGGDYGGAGIGGGYNGKPGTLTMNGNAVVFASSVGDTDESRRTGGILFEGDNTTGTFYGKSVTITDDVEIPAGYFLAVPAHTTLTIPAGITLTNKGMVYCCGTINHGGGYGEWAGNPYIVCAPENIAWKGSTGSGGSDWNNSSNWEPQIFPTGRDIVTIPGNVKVFPDLYNSTNPPFEAGEIHFAPGAQLKGQSLLDYNKAFAGYDFNNDNKRNRWLMLSMPLGEAFPGDFVFCGYPLTWMRTFSSTANEGVTTGSWVPIQGSDQALSSGDGFVLWLDENTQGVTDKGLARLGNIHELPYFQYLLTDYEKYHGVNLAHEYSDITQKSTFYYFSKKGEEYDRDDSNPPYTVDRTDEAYQLVKNEQGFSKEIEFKDGIFALIGNPYMAVLDFDEFSYANQGTINPKYYVWIDDGEGNGTYGVYNSGIREGIELDENIAPMQGFIVEKYSGSSPSPISRYMSIPELSFNESMTKVDPDIVLRSSGSAGNKLNIVAANPLKEIRTTIAKREGGQNEYGILDARKIMNGISDVPEIYTLKQYNGGPLGVAINVINNDDLLIPLGLATSYTGNITLTFTGMDTYDAKLSLIDLETNETIDLTGLPSYEHVVNYTPKKIDGKTIACNDRFIIRISKTATGLQETFAEKVNVFETNGQIRIVLGASNPIKEVAVFNLQGMLMYKANAINAVSHTIKRTLPAGVYIVKVISEKNVDNVKLIVR